MPQDQKPSGQVVSSTNNIGKSLKDANATPALAPVSTPTPIVVKTTILSNTTGVREATTAEIMSSGDRESVCNIL